MRKEIIASGKDLQAAINNAKEALGVDPLSDISYEIIDLGSKGIFGIIGANTVATKSYFRNIPGKLLVADHSGRIHSTCTVDFG